MQLEFVLGAAGQQTADAGDIDKQLDLLARHDEKLRAQTRTGAELVAEMQSGLSGQYGS